MKPTSHHPQQGIREGAIARSPCVSRSTVSAIMYVVASSYIKYLARFFVLFFPSLNGFFFLWRRQMLVAQMDADVKDVKMCLG